MALYIVSNEWPLKERPSLHILCEGLKLKNLAASMKIFRMYEDFLVKAFLGE